MTALAIWEGPQLVFVIQSRWFAEMMCNSLLLSVQVRCWTSWGAISVGQNVRFWGLSEGLNDSEKETVYQDVLLIIRSWLLMLGTGYRALTAIKMVDYVPPLPMLPILLCLASTLATLVKAMVEKLKVRELALATIQILTWNLPYWD